MIGVRYPSTFCSCYTEGAGLNTRENFKGFDQRSERRGRRMGRDRFDKIVVAIALVLLTAAAVSFVTLLLLPGTGIGF